MMRRLKSWRMFLEDGVAAVSASTTGGMNAVTNAVVGALPGVGGAPGSGDVSSYLTDDEEKKGNPSEVSDLRFLDGADTNEVDDLKKKSKKKS